MRTITACRSCNSTALTAVLDLGNQYLSDFRDDLVRPPRVPLQMLLCTNCTLVQLRHTADPEDLYHPRYSFKSGVNPAIRADLADVVEYALGFKSNPASWLDIACNDGTLLASVPNTVFRGGVDPLPQFADEAREHADRIVVGFFNPADWLRRFDVVTSISMFYDIDDPNGFVDGVKQVLAADGVWVIQQNYLPTMIDVGSVDNVSHEHLTYWSLASLEPLLARHGLQVVDVELNPINGGCFRTAVARTGRRPVSPSVQARRNAEAGAGLGELATFEAFAGRAAALLASLASLIAEIRARGETVWVYGASTRGGTLWQAAGLTADDLPAVVDRNPDKVGRRMSAIGAPIVSEAAARAARPDYLLVGPWWFADQFVRREHAYLQRGGRIIIPLPRITVVDAPRDVEAPAQIART